MSPNSAKPAGALLVGSVPLENSEEVFTISSRILGNHLRRVPDGETAERVNWLCFQIDVRYKYSTNTDFVNITANRSMSNVFQFHCK